MLSCRGPDFLAVDDVAVIGCLSKGLDTPGLKARIRLGDSKTALALALNQLGQPSLLLLIVAEDHDRMGSKNIDVYRRRGCHGARGIGVITRCLELAASYAKQRSTFGAPLADRQAVQFMLADMAMEIDAARALVWRGAWLGKHQKYRNAEGSMAKLKAGRVAVWATERAIQILGGYGYVRDYPVERWHRDAKIYDIFEGTEQIQQLVISRAISGMRIE